MPPTTVTDTAAAVERFTLGNGLRVVAAPQPGIGVVGVAVYYDVGFRSEPPGRTGFAHLFEHLMFQGSAQVGKMEHAHLVQGAGGTMNGSTHPDFTNYYQAVPAGALELVLFCEADRMRSVALTEENLANQVAVVQNEIRVNVLNRPYGGFPWISLPPVAFSTFPNAHNGYGDFAELEQASLADAEDFFQRFYAPANAVLVICGDASAAEMHTLAERYFADVEARPAPQRPSFAEPELTERRRHAETDPLAPTPALAMGWRSPDAVADPRRHLATVVLAELLAEGDASRLRRRLVLGEQTAISVECYLNAFGDPFEQRDPALFTVTAVHPPDVGCDTVIHQIDEEIERIAGGGLDAAELRRVTAVLRAQLARGQDQVLGRTLQLALFELLHADAGRALRLEAEIAALGVEDVVAAAAAVSSAHPAILELRAGADQQGAA